MKINDCFVQREVYATYLLVPVYRNEISNNIVSFNRTGALILKEAQAAFDKQELLRIVNNRVNQENSDVIKSQLNEFIEQLIIMKYLIEE